MDPTPEVLSSATLRRWLLDDITYWWLIGLWMIFLPVDVSQLGSYPSLRHEPAGQVSTVDTTASSTSEIPIPGAPAGLIPAR